MKDDTKTKGKALPFSQHRGENTRSPKYLVKKMLPETGTALLSGQWGTYKSFVAVAISAAVATGDPFIGHDIKRRGAVLIFAMEGVNDLPTRLDAASIVHHDNQRLPVFLHRARHLSAR
jgi:RecA-family ATPase